MRVNKKLIRERFEANFETYNRVAVVQQTICEQLAEHLRRFERVDIRRGLEVGVGTGFLTKLLAQLYPNAEWWLNDIAPSAEKWTAQQVPNLKAHYLCGDVEAIEFPLQLDLIASASTIQWLENTPAFATKAAQATTNGGLLVLSTFGPNNFNEIRSTTGEGLEYLSINELERVFKKVGYRIFTLQESSTILHFPSPLEVLRHIKATGVNSVSKTNWTRSQLAKFDTDYRNLFSTPNGVTLTYHTIILIAEMVK